MASINAPVSVADVVAQAGNYTYNAQIPLASWLVASTPDYDA
jgi:STAM-binding protein